MTDPRLDEFRMKDLTRLTEEDIREVAAGILLEPEFLGAVFDVESNGVGYTDDGLCLMRFEAHIFEREDDTYIDGPPNDYGTLLRAIEVDRTAALRSASWGMFQIMGFNHALCGLPSVEAHVQEHCVSERRQLELVAEFLTNAGNILDHARVKNWPGFALRYNGPQYRRNKYDVKLREAYERRKGIGPGATRPLALGHIGDDVRALQRRLNEVWRGQPLTVDGHFGTNTHRVVLWFQANHGLTPDGVVGPLTRQALNLTPPPRRT